jgi:hypothetical protein
MATENTESTEKNRLSPAKYFSVFSVATWFEKLL